MEAGDIHLVSPQFIKFHTHTHAHTHKQQRKKPWLWIQLWSALILTHHDFLCVLSNMHEWHHFQRLLSGFHHSLWSVLHCSFGSFLSKLWCKHLAAGLLGMETPLTWGQRIRQWLVLLFCVLPFLQCWMHLYALLSCPCGQAGRTNQHLDPATQSRHWTLGTTSDSRPFIA